MSIANELRSDIAIALLTENGSTNRESLLQVLLMVHSTLSSLSPGVRPRSLAEKPGEALRVARRSAASGNS